MVFEAGVIEQGKKPAQHPFKNELNLATASKENVPQRKMFFQKIKSVSCIILNLVILGHTIPF